MGKHRVIVVGAGIMGCWSALMLRRSGANVRLLESWDAGHTRSSSGGETRVLRHSYVDAEYVKMVTRARDLWREHGSHWGVNLFEQVGLLFMFRKAGIVVHDAITKQFSGHNIDYEKLTPQEIEHRYPQISTRDIEAGLFEPCAGILNARVACQVVKDAFIREGGEYQTANVMRVNQKMREATGLSLNSGEDLAADDYLFAVGPWLGKIFPGLIPKLRVTRQEVFFYGTEAADPRYTTQSLPVWADLGDSLWYGIPSHGQSGFKVADDRQHYELDPDQDERVPSSDGGSQSREYLRMRFPQLGNAPQIDAKVCQYTLTPQHHLIVDQHPEMNNVWILGGGSGHGFKHSPALGELVVNMILKGLTPPSLFQFPQA